MTHFTEREMEYLKGERKLARLATVGKTGMPHVVPVGWSYDEESGTINIRGFDLEQTKKFRDVEHSGRAALVIDDVLPPWRPRGIEVRGDAETVLEPEPLIRIHPKRIVSWGFESKERGKRHARSVS